MELFGIGGGVGVAIGCGVIPTRATRGFNGRKGKVFHIYEYIFSFIYMVYICVYMYIIYKKKYGFTKKILLVHKRGELTWVPVYLMYTHYMYIHNYGIVPYLVYNTYIPMYTYIYRIHLI